jgi:hypothetical protein
MYYFAAVTLLIFVIEPVLGFNVFDSFKMPFGPNEDAGLVQKRKELKTLLLKECEGGSSRERIEEIIADMADVSPTPESASSPLLQSKWLMKWTTEKEINFFVDWNLSSQVTQTIDANAVLQNNIEFQRGGYLGVTGVLSTEGGVRTDFEFTEATLDLGKFGSYQIPPVGKGWFDTVYLDEDLRVDTNSRNDILICERMD